MAFQTGSVITIRYFRGARLRQARPSRVVEDGDRGLLVWLAGDTPIKSRMTVDGRSPRRLADQLAAEWHLADTTWWGEGILQWFPPDNAAHSVWWFFEKGVFDSWYVNLEDPAVRWADGVDTSDHALDVVVRPDRRWSLKDEDEFAERTGHRWYWSEEEALEIQAEAQRVAAVVDEGRFPFDGTWCDFKPPPEWPTPELPPTWNADRKTAR